MKGNKESKHFYGWWVVGGLYLVSFLSAWSRYILAAIINFINQDLGWSISEINLSLSIALWVYAAAVILSGRLIDRWGGRKVIFTGSIILSVGFIMLSRATTLQGLYFSHGVLLALATAMMMNVPVQAIARKWFLKRASFVAGLLGTAFAISQILLGPVFTQGASVFGWRSVCLAISLFGVATFIVTFFLIQDTPEAIGLRPYGYEEASEQLSFISDSGSQDKSVAQAIKMGSFWAFFLAYGLVAIPIQGLLTNAVNWANHIGVHPGAAGLAITAIGIGAIPGKIIWGILGDKLGKHRSLVFGSLVGFAVFLVGNLFVNTNMRFYILCVFFGLSYGYIVSLVPPYVGDLFGRRNIASLFGIITAAHGFIGGFGPILWGLTYDKTGSYDLAILISCFIYLFVAIFFFFARPKSMQQQNS